MPAREPSAPPTAPGPGTPAAAHGRSGPVFGLLALAITLRAPLVAVPPVLSEIARDLGVTDASAALMTSIPVLCFGLLTPPSSWLLRRTGLRLAGVICILGLIVGSVVRVGGSFALALIGTTILGAAITIGNLVAPVLIGRVFPQSAPVLTGSYSATLNVGATAATAATAGLAVSWGWQLATAWWGVGLGLIALVVWLATCPRAPMEWDAPRQQADGTPEPVARRSVLRWPTAWFLAGAFSCQSLSYYAVTTWLPGALRDDLGMTAATAGAAAAVFQIAGIAGPFLVPALIATLRPSERTLVLTIATAWISLPLGMLLAQGWWPVWVGLGGIAQGGFFTTIFLLVIRRSQSNDENRRLSAMVQTIGYCVAAVGPVLLGAAVSRVESWSFVYGTVAVVLALMTTSALFAIRQRPA